MMPVPVSNTVPHGTRLARVRYSTRVSKRRCSRAVETQPENNSLPPRVIVQVISSRYGSGRLSAVTITGPSAQQPLNTLDCVRYSAFSRSMSHAETSLANVNPAMRPPLPSTTASSGSGAVNRESTRIPRSEEHTSELQSHSDLHSFPTRRSSDLRDVVGQRKSGDAAAAPQHHRQFRFGRREPRVHADT